MDTWLAVLLALGALVAFTLLVFGAALGGSMFMRGDLRVRRRHGTTKPKG